MNAETPRTYKVAYFSREFSNNHQWVVSAEHACQLERELAEATKLLRRAQPQLAEARTWEQRYNEQTVALAEALRERDTLKRERGDLKHARLQEISERQGIEAQLNAAEADSHRLDFLQTLDPEATAAWFRIMDALDIRAAIDAEEARRP